jgi:hypothetical protein
MFPFVSASATIFQNPSEAYILALSFVIFDRYGFSLAFRTLVVVHFRLLLGEETDRVKPSRWWESIGRRLDSEWLRQRTSTL